MAASKKAAKPVEPEALVTTRDAFGTAEKHKDERGALITPEYQPPSISPELVKAREAELKAEAERNK